MWRVCGALAPHTWSHHSEGSTLLHKLLEGMLCSLLLEVISGDQGHLKHSGSGRLLAFRVLVWVQLPPQDPLLQRKAQAAPPVTVASHAQPNPHPAVPLQVAEDQLSHLSTPDIPSLQVETCTSHYCSATLLLLSLERLFAGVLQLLPHFAHKQLRLSFRVLPKRCCASCHKYQVLAGRSWLWDTGSSRRRPNTWIGSHHMPASCFLKA